MKKFNLEAEKTFRRTVKFEHPDPQKTDGFIEYEFTGHFTLIDSEAHKKAVDEITAAATDGVETPAAAALAAHIIKREFAKRIMPGFSGVTGADGKEIDCNEKNLHRLLNDRIIADAVVRTYNEAMSRRGQEKN